MITNVEEYVHDGIKFYHVGCYRYVVHFLDMLSEQDKMDVEESLNGKPYTSVIFAEFALAKQRANKLGGRKYTAKWFGGGLVFKCCEPSFLAKKINALKK